MNLGEKFGRLILIELGEKARYRKGTFKCDCGVEKEYYLSNVTSGKTKSMAVI